MYQRRRSTLGRRHLLAQQQAQGNKPVQPQSSTNTVSGGNGSRNPVGSDSWRGRRSEKKKTPSHLDRASRELIIKKRLFNKSPAEFNHIRTYSVQEQERTHNTARENSLNETGISSIAPTPSSSSRSVPLNSASAQRRRADMEFDRYRPYTLPSSLSTAFAKSDTNDEFSKLASTSNSQKGAISASYDFENLKPPDSPGPSRYNKLILEEKLEKPVDPDLEKLSGLTLEDPNVRLKFSPPLSSTCIGSPDSGKKINANIIKETLKESVQNSGRKLSIIQEDCNSSVVEFEHLEQTINELDDTIIQSALNNTLKPHVTCLENIVEKHVTYLDVKEESEQTWKNVFSCIDNMERAVINRAKESISNVKTLKQQVVIQKRALENQQRELENLQKAVDSIERHAEDKFKEDIENIKATKKLINSLKSKSTIARRSSQNKENNLSYAATCKKKLLEEEKWFNSIKSENPSLLKTPNFNRRMNYSSVWTPHSLSKALHEQMNELYD